MKQSIGYDRQELEGNFKFILASIERFDDEVRMMEEQGLGLRDNLDWQSSACNLRIELEKIKRGLNYFNVLERIPYVDLESREGYLSNYLTRVTENFCRDRYEENR